jgi:hypothetical protein
VNRTGRRYDDDEDDRPSRKGRRYDDDEDDDDDYDDKPRRKAVRKPKKAKKRDTGFAARLALIGGGGFLAIVVAVVFVFISSRGSKQLSPPIQKDLSGKVVPGNQPAAALPPPELMKGWITFTDPNGAYSVGMPAQPVAQSASAKGVTINFFVTTTADAEEFRVGSNNMSGSLPKSGLSQSDWKKLGDGLSNQLGASLGNETGRQTLNVAGRQGLQMDFDNGQFRSRMVALLDGQTVYYLIYAGTRFATRDTFFASFRFLR